MEYASNGKANAALTTGIIGTAGFGAQLLGNLLGGGWGGWGANPAAAAAMAAGACSDNTPVTRYELDREQQLAAKDSEIALLKANTYNDQKSLELYAYVDGQLKSIREELCKQAVHNQRTEDSFTLVKQDVDCVRKEALGAVKMEAERRCCGDNSIVTYANATFYPKQVADVTTGTANTAQTLYDPLPKCGCGCCKN
nr:MAG TPA: hypothetical protein [Caudoviricetes sp.]DAR37918.1 MAG TPA: hypothetical protein [Caudoviricetes sp.]